MVNYEATYIQIVKIDTLLDNYIIYAKTDVPLKIDTMLNDNITYSKPKKKNHIRYEVLEDNFIYPKTDTLKLKIVVWKCSVCCNNISIGDRLLVSLSRDRIGFGHNVLVARGRDRIAVEYEWGRELLYVKEIYGLCYTQDKETLKEYEQWLKEYFLPSLQEYYPPFRKKN